MRVPRSWLSEFVDLPESDSELRDILDDLGLVVEAVDQVGAGLEQVVVARVEEIHAIPGADRIRRVVIDAGDGPVEVVCGAWNFAVGQHVPFAPVGTVLPGGLAINRRVMRGVTSNGMLCSPQELEIGDDHGGLLILDDRGVDQVGQPVGEALGLAPDVVYTLSVEGNRPDAWSIYGVARDLAARLGRPVRAPGLAAPDGGLATADVAHAVVGAPALCARLTVSVLDHVVIGPSPAWVVRRLERAGMRAISNVVDASNYVMLELGQPTHPYDLDRVAGATLQVRAALPGETLTTLDGVRRDLARPGRGLGDTGIDCVITDGDDQVIGLAGIMGGASTEIAEATTRVLVEAACFDAMSIARSSKRHGLRTEASTRFERGVDPELALRAVARLVEVLRASIPGLVWCSDPLDVRGEVTPPARVELRSGDVERALGAPIEEAEVRQGLEALGFAVAAGAGGGLVVSAPSSRPDVREGAAGRADVIEEIARLHGYRRLPRRTPTWAAPGGLSDAQRLRRRLRTAVVDLGVTEVWTPSLVSERQFARTHAQARPVRVTNPLASDSVILRPTLVSGIAEVFARNRERGLVDLRLGELGVVFAHPGDVAEPRRSRGGVGGSAQLELPTETERLTVLLGHHDDDATTAVALWVTLAGLFGLDESDFRLRTRADVAATHPTRTAEVVTRGGDAVVGVVGELDPDLVLEIKGAPGRIGLLDLDISVLESVLAARPDRVAQVPSRFPSALIDLAFTVPLAVPAGDVADALRATSVLVESVRLFDVYRGAGVPADTRSLAFAVRLSAPDHTLEDAEVAALRQQLIDAAAAGGARLR